MSELHRITVNPDQCGGRPCIRGLRVRVKDILELLSDQFWNLARLQSFACAWKPGLGVRRALD